MIFSFVFLTSCFDKGDCLITSTNLVKITLQKKQDGSPKTVIFLKVQEMHNLDTVDFVPDTIGVTTLQLPLNPNLQETSFFFLTKDSLPYHLTLGYNTYTRIISADCGAYLYYNKLSVKDTNFDSTKVIFPQLLNSVNKNLEVFF